MTTRIYSKTQNIKYCFHLKKSCPEIKFTKPDTTQHQDYEYEVLRLIQLEERTLWGKKSFPNNIIRISLTLQTSCQLDHLYHKPS